jgi:hypothetical protein
MSGEQDSGTPDPFMPDKEEESVFQKTQKTVTFSNGYQNDGKDPSFRLLNASSMAASAAISNIPPGTHQNVVRGDAVHHYLQNVLTLIDHNDTLQVDGQQSETVTLDARHFYKANFLRGVSGNDHIRVNQVRDIIVLGESSEQYLGKHEVMAPEEFEWKSFERGFSFTKIDLMGIGLDTHAANVELYGANVGVGVNSTEGTGFHQEGSLQHEHAPLFHTKEGVEVDALFRLDALIDIGTGTPFR